MNEAYMTVTKKATELRAGDRFVVLGQVVTITRAVRSAWRPAINVWWDAASWTTVPEDEEVEVIAENTLMEINDVRPGMKVLGINGDYHPVHLVEIFANRTRLLRTMGVVLCEFTPTTDDEDKVFVLTSTIPSTV